MALVKWVDLYDGETGDYPEEEGTQGWMEPVKYDTLTIDQLIEALRACADRLEQVREDDD